MSEIVKKNSLFEKVKITHESSMIHAWSHSKGNETSVKEKRLMRDFFVILL